MKTAVLQVSHRGTLVEQAGICSTCVPPGAGKTRRGGTPAIPCPVSKIGVCSTWAIKKQHTPASARHSPVVALCGLFSGGAETCLARTEEATSERAAGKGRTPCSCQSERSEESVLSASNEACCYIAPVFTRLPPGQAEPPAVHRLPHDTGRKPGPTSLDEKERRNEK